MVGVILAMAYTAIVGGGAGMVYYGFYKNPKFLRKNLKEEIREDYLRKQQEKAILQETHQDLTPAYPTIDSRFEK
ncbi:MAG: hypothetical protein KKF46_06790 [Nanoarchaeota archaeon]|nr:hypothetical protein [Nanoarchaeota archaeon]MBU1322036.1 hypothetical protein [Nanoarchaeota archaeon]MBU1597228.1 hypothetical protein [Nanoarchaeota archaeon]MBU2440727.1 hypothetical protein [Nanoarchaeota archaeon]